MKRLTRSELLEKAEKEFNTGFTLELAKELENGENAEFWEQKLREHFENKN